MGETVEFWELTLSHVTISKKKLYKFFRLAMMSDKVIAHAVELILNRTSFCRGRLVLFYEIVDKSVSSKLLIKLFRIPIFGN